MKRMIAWCMLILLLLPLVACSTMQPDTETPVETVQLAPDAGSPATVPSAVDAPVPSDAAQNAGFVLPVAPTAAATDQQTLRVLFINVGKADAILLQYGGANALIDTGTEESAPRLLGALAFLGVEKLDALFLTHTHKDHIGGVPILGSKIPIQQAYAAHFSENKKNGENKIDLAVAETGAPLHRLSAGDTVPFAGGTSFSVLGPLAYNKDDDNDNSLVLRFNCNGRTLLLTGDMQFAEEATLLDAQADLSADVLKVGNHGNPDATSEPFALAVSPGIAVISTDTSEDADSANPRVIAALSGAQVLVTQDTTLGVLLQIAPDHTMTLYDAAPEPSGAQIRIVDVDKNTQTVTLQNDGARVDLSGCMLLSQKGGELFRFAEGSAIKAGAQATIAAEGKAGDFVFAGETEPWHKKKADTAILYDRFGLELARK